MKKILAAILSLTMVCALAGCSDSSSDSSKAEETTTTTTAATTAETTTTTAETTTTTTTAESESPDETAGTTSVAANDEVTYLNNVVTGAFYTFEIDETKWTMGSSAGVDCLFSYAITDTNPDFASATINVVSMSSESLNGITAADYAEQVKTQYEAMDGYTVTNDEEGTFNGMDVYLVDVTAEIGSITMYLNQIIIPDGNNLAVITYGADDAAYDDMQAEFKAVTDTFKML